jgi:hypothetical protein
VVVQTWGWGTRLRLRLLRVQRTRGLGWVCCGMLLVLLLVLLLLRLLLRLGGCKVHPR